MEALQRQGLLAFISGSNRWEWDLEQIEGRTDVSENVVGLLIEKIHGMTPLVQQVLMLASSLGFMFGIDALEKIVISEGILRVGEKEAKRERPRRSESTSPNERSSQCRLTI